MDARFVVQQSPLDDDFTHLRLLLGVRGRVPAGTRRAPVGAVLVLDRSGSMAGGKLEAVVRASKGLIRRLHPRDRVGVVAFDDRVELLAEPATGVEQEGVAQLLDALSPRGMTNLSGGWLRGAEALRPDAHGEGIHRVILLTDGRANEGITDPARLAELVARARRDGITTTTVGVGEGFDEELLRTLADAGGGNAWYIEEHDQADDVFGAEIEGLLSLGAQNLRVALTPADEVELTAVHHGYPARAEGTTLHLDLGDLYAREPRELLVDLVVAAGTRAREVARIVLEADVVEDDGGMVHRRITVPVHFDPDGTPSVHPEVERCWSLLQATEARRDAVARGDAGDVIGAAAGLEQAADELEARLPDDTDARREADDLRRTARTLREEQVMRDADRKYIYARAEMQARSRSAAADVNRRR